MEGVGFVEAGQLGIGSAIVTRAGPSLVVKSVEREQHAEGLSVYNFEVEEDHTYFVGKAGGGAWVHNTCWLARMRPNGTVRLTGPQNALEHWNAHRMEFPELNNAKEYADMARRLLLNPPDGSYVRDMGRGIINVYDPATNTFVSGTDAGIPATMFRPTYGSRYFLAQGRFGFPVPYQ